MRKRHVLRTRELGNSRAFHREAGKPLGCSQGGGITAFGEQLKLRLGEMGHKERL